MPCLVRAGQKKIASELQVAEDATKVIEWNLKRTISIQSFSSVLDYIMLWNDEMSDVVSLQLGFEDAYAYITFSDSKYFRLKSTLDVYLVAICLASDNKHDKFLVIKSKEFEDIGLYQMFTSGLENSTSRNNFSSTIRLLDVVRMLCYWEKVDMHQPSLTLSSSSPTLSSSSSTLSSSSSTIYSLSSILIGTPSRKPETFSSDHYMSLQQKGEKIIDLFKNPQILSFRNQKEEEEEEAEEETKEEEDLEEY